MIIMSQDRLNQESRITRPLALSLRTSGEKTARYKHDLGKEPLLNFGVGPQSTASTLHDRLKLLRAPISRTFTLLGKTVALGCF